MKDYDSIKQKQRSKCHFIYDIIVVFILFSKTKKDNCLSEWIFCFFVYLQSNQFNTDRERFIVYSI